MKPLPFLIVFGLLLIAGPAAGQIDESLARGVDESRVFCEALTFWTPAGVPRLDIYIDVPYGGLHFAKLNDKFHASYNVTVDLHDSTDKLIADKYWTETVDAATYDESVSPKSNRLSQQSFEIAPGRYTVTVQVTDSDTKRTTTFRRRIVIRDAAQQEFWFSDPMLINRIDTVGEKKIVSPNISGNVGNLPNGFFILLEFYNKAAFDSVIVTYRIKSIRGDVVQGDSSHESVRPPRKSLFMKVNSQKLVAGDYLLEVAAWPMAPRKSGEGLKPLWVSTRSFMIHWRGLPVSIVDLDQAIDQLQYIADKDAMEAMKKAPAEEKKRLFNEFWAKRDPTPGSERNELMEEYFARVEYANKHFSHYVDGWKTDMGMVYIIFGMPNNIERHPFDIDAKPYEIWTYYEQNREFVFVDATGFGDYRLQNPIWDLWRTRPR